MHTIQLFFGGGDQRVENEVENVENEKYPNNNWMLCINFVFKIT